jgi:hypothetical protein
LPCKEDEKNEKPIQPKVSLNQSWLKAVLELRAKTYLLMPGNEGSVPPPLSASSLKHKLGKKIPSVEDLAKTDRKCLKRLLDGLLFCSRPLPLAGITAYFFTFISDKTPTT